jgi:hypothetical protein
MHVCLSIPEILDIICNELAPSDDLDGVYNHDLASLAALARTSRTFSEPALNAIWCGLPTLVPLLRCMPSDLWGEMDMEEGDPLEFVRLLNAPLRVFTITLILVLILKVPTTTHRVERLDKIRLLLQTREKLRLCSQKLFRGG